MRAFDHPNLHGFKCPICGTADDKPVVLIGVQGTEDGNIIEALQYHLDCIELRVVRRSELPGHDALFMFYQNLGNK